MSGVIRDFSQQSIADLLDIIDRKAENEEQWGLFDWFQDTFLMEELDIKQNVDNVTAYHEHVIDKHNIGLKKFDEILQKVETVDRNYASRMYCVYDIMESFNTKINNIADMISPSVITADTAELEAIAAGIGQNYEADKKDTQQITQALEASLDEYLEEETAWWEKGLNALGGFAVSVVMDVVVEPALMLGQGLDALTGGWIGFDSVEAQWIRDGIDNYIVENFVTDEKWYYGGRVVGDVVVMVVGAIAIASGITTILGGITVTAGGMLLSATGVGAVVGAPAIAVSGAAVAVGAAQVAVGGVIIAGSYNNFQNNIQKFESSSSSGSGGSTELPKDVKVNQGQQDKHIPGTNNYNQEIANGRPRSILTENAQDLLDEFAGTGQQVGSTKERVDFGRTIGQYYDPATGTYTNTTKGIIHYNSQGQAHIVPARP